MFAKVISLSHDTGVFLVSPRLKVLSDARRTRIILSVVQIHTFGGCGPENCKRESSRIICSLAMSKVVRVKKAQKLVGIILVAIAMSVSVATPAHASGEEAATDAMCDVAYYLYPHYYSDYCSETV
jgi:hypothetical protein